MVQEKLMSKPKNYLKSKGILDDPSFNWDRGRPRTDKKPRYKIEPRLRSQGGGWEILDTHSGNVSVFADVDRQKVNEEFRRLNAR